MERKLTRTENVRKKALDQEREIQEIGEEMADALHQFGVTLPSRESQSSYARYAFSLGTRSYIAEVGVNMITFDRR